MQPSAFHYEEKDENFPEIGPSRKNDNLDIGKILSRYQFRTTAESHNNRNNNHTVHTGTALNYTQIYQDLRMQKNPIANPSADN